MTQQNIMTEKKDGKCNINWPEFEAPYWSPTKNQQHELVITKWRQEQRDFKDGKGAKNVIVVNLLKVDGEEHAIGQKEFCSGAASFAKELRPIIEWAEQHDREAVEIMLTYGKDNQYDLRRID